MHVELVVRNRIVLRKELSRARIRLKDMKTARVVGGELPLEHYRAAMEKLPLATVDIVILNPERTEALLGRRKNEPYAGTFYTFGGRLYKNEEFASAAIRLAKKECGLLLSPADIVEAGVLNEISENSIFEGINYHAVNIYFACTIKEPEVTLDDQHSEAQWFAVDDPTLHPNVQTKIAGALRTL